jgi:hypothetical protein
MNKLVILGLSPIFVLTAPQAFADPQHCDKDSWPCCYDIGYRHGQFDTSNGFSYSCDHHSENYCKGYSAGYSSNNTNNLEQSQASTVTIHGNNNDVNVEQGQSVNSGSGGGTDGGSDGGSSYHGANPRCLLICAAVNH